MYQNWSTVRNLKLAVDIEYGQKFLSHSYWWTWSFYVCFMIESLATWLFYFMVNINLSVCLCGYNCVISSLVETKLTSTVGINKAAAWNTWSRIWPKSSPFLESWGDNFFFWKISAKSLPIFRVTWMTVKHSLIKKQIRLHCKNKKLWKTAIVLRMSWKSVPIHCKKKWTRTIGSGIKSMSKNAVFLLDSHCF